MINIESFMVGQLATNCYLVFCGDTAKATVIDPGFEETEVEGFLKKIECEALQIEYIVNTHGHLDHISGNRALKMATGAEVLIHEGDAGMLVDPSENLSTMLGRDVTSPRADRLLREGDIIKVGNVELKVIHTPGHSRGSISLYVKEGDVVFTGDTLFAGSIGRTDLLGSSFTSIMSSLRDRLIVLPDRTLVYPGHGERTTIGRERVTNPFLSVEV